MAAGFAIAVLAAGCSGLPLRAPAANSEPVMSLPTTASPLNASSVQQARLVTARFGWALADGTVFVTDDAGSSWRSLLAPFKPVALTAEDADHIVVATIAGQSVKIAATTDGGAQWNMATVLTSAPVGSVDLRASAEIRAAVVRYTTSANFSEGDLLISVRGGEWIRRRLPAAGAVTIQGPERLWLAGAVTSGQLWTSDDLGQSWELIAIPELAGKAATFAAPIPIGGDLLLPVTINGDVTSELYFASATDKSDWQPVGRVDGLSPTDPGVALANAGIDPEHWLLATPAGPRLFITQTRGTDFSLTTPSGLPEGVVSLSFPSTSAGWALVATGSCATEKTGCGLDQAVFATSDAGETWRRLAVTNR